MTLPPRPTNADLLAESELECLLYNQIEQARLPRPYWQYKVDGHKCDLVWCADAYPDLRFIVEVQGGTWKRGRHSREPGYSADRAFSNRCQLDGWRVLEVTADQVNSLAALGWVREGLEAKC